MSGTEHIRLKLGKVKFYQKQVGYIGRIITDRGIKPDPVKVIAINNYPSPKNVKDLERWLSMVNFLQEFYPEMSKEIDPLNELQRKNALWNWEVNQEVVKKIKNIISENN